MGNITLNIKGNQLPFGFENIDLTTSAKLCTNENGIVIDYCNEIQAQTIITVEKDMVSFIRPDFCDGQILFKRDMPFTFSCKTDKGPIGINVYTTLVESNREEAKGKIELEYLTELMGEQLVGKLHMSFSACNDKEDCYEN